ncbi:MAG: aminotransferase class I/II-fold pyridoxal phosphate-dependent enzyme [Vicinamibacterales bacterium]
MTRNDIVGTTAVDIAGSIERAVYDGRLKPGEGLPTVRALATTLRVSPTTVAAAYKLLQGRGFVSGRGRHGTRITSRPPSPAVSVRLRVPDGAIDLSTGNPDPELLPSLEDALRAVDPAPRLYDGPTLLPALSTFVAGELEADGLPASALTLVGGGLDAIERVLREHLRAGDRVAVEDPSFPGVLDLLAANGFLPASIAMDDEGPLPDAMDAALRSRARAVVVTPRAQNPWGAALTTARGSDLRRVLRAYPDVLLVEDDHLGPIAGAPLSTVCDLSRPRWAFVRSVSKFLGPDLRAAFVAGDPMTMARVEGRQSVGTRWVSHILQQLVLALWSDPASGRRLARAADVYRQRREAMLSALASHGIGAHGASGLNVWVPLGAEAHAAQALLERGWVVAAGERFRLRSPAGIRVTTAALQPRDAARFAADLAEVLRPARTRSLA